VTPGAAPRLATWVAAAPAAAQRFTEDPVVLHWQVAAGRLQVQVACGAGAGSKAQARSPALWHPAAPGRIVILRIARPPRVLKSGRSGGRIPSSCCGPGATVSGRPDLESYGQARGLSTAHRHCGSPDGHLEPWYPMISYMI
jgi:hypothetical protein